MKKKIRDLTDKEKLEIIDYEEISTNFNRKNWCYKTALTGNTFYIKSYKKQVFSKTKIKEKVVLWLCMACGVARITIIDILKAYNLLTDDDEIEVEDDKN